MDSACALLADVVPVSSHKSAFKIRTKLNQIWLNFGWQFWRVQGAFWMKSAFKIRAKIQPNLVEFWVAILAGPRRFLDEISFQNSHKNSTKFG